MKTNIRNITLGALLAIGLGAPYLQAADVAISALPTGSALAGTEPIPMVQGAATKKTTPADLSTYLLSGSATTEVLANNAGAFDGDSGFTFNATNNTVDLGGATLTASDPVLDLSQTWNNAGVTFTGLKFNVTDTTSAAASLLADFQVGGASKLAVKKNGDVTVAANAVIASASGVMALNYGVTAGLVVGSNIYTDRIGVTSGILSIQDVHLNRDSADALAQRRSTNTQTSRIYNTYTDASNYERLSLVPGAASGWMQVKAETAGTGTDNINVALTPAGTGAISAHVPDSTSAGGNARGVSAVDLQLSRSAATQVASGANTFVAGIQNTASALYSLAIGSQNTASGQSAVALGHNGTASGYQSGVLSGATNSATGSAAVVVGGGSNIAGGAYSWVPGGYQATTRGLVGAGAYSAGQRAASGDAQVILQPVRRTTIDDTPVSLATDGTPAATTVMVLPASSTLMCTAMVVAQSASALNNAGYQVLAVIQRDGSSNTALVGTATTTTVGEDTAGMDATIIANDTLESAEIQVTGVDETIIQWMGELKCVQVL